MRISREKGMWRCFFDDNEQSLEVTWPRASVGIKKGQHGRSKHLWVGLGFVQAFIPLGIDQRPEEYGFGDEPQWGINMSKEYGVILSLGLKRKVYGWLFRRETLHYDYLGVDDKWYGVIAKHADRTVEPKTDVFPYDYTLRSGEVQHRTITVQENRFITGRRHLHKIGWPKKTDHSIDFRFDKEVGERSGSWKGGVLGSGENIRDGETWEDTVRRMERDRKFT